jgi:hypothetical protein
MAKWVEVQQGKPRVRIPNRKDRLPKTPAAELAAPYRDPRNGRFGAGNPGGRLRQVAALARVTAESLLRLETAQVAPFLRGHLGDAQRHAQALVDVLPATTDELVALCADEARARLMANACVTEGSKAECTADEARAWREEARAWLREVRQIVMTRRAVAKETPAKPKAEDSPWFTNDDPSDARSLPESTDAASNTEPPSESNVAQSSDMVNGPKEGIE